VVGKFAAALGPKATSADLDSAVLRQDVIKVLGRTHSAESMKREVGNIKTFGKWLEAQEILDIDPFRKVKEPTPPKPEMRVIAKADAERLFASYDLKRADQARDYALIMLTLTTGMRISEVCTAKLTDLNLEEGWLQVWGKGNKQRPVHPNVRPLLWKWARGTRERDERAGSEYLFVSRDGRAPCERALPRQDHSPEPALSRALPRSAPRGGNLCTEGWHGA
jgi:integrase/recombinase XerD